MTWDRELPPPGGLPDRCPGGRAADRVAHCPCSGNLHAITAIAAEQVTVARTGAVRCGVAAADDVGDSVADLDPAVRKAGHVHPLDGDGAALVDPPLVFVVGKDLYRAVGAGCAGDGRRESNAIPRPGVGPSRPVCAVSDLWVQWVRSAALNRAELQAVRVHMGTNTVRIKGCWKRRERERHRQSGSTFFKCQPNGACAPAMLLMQGG